MFTQALPLVLGALVASASTVPRAFIPVNSSDPVNATISAYIDPVLMDIAANPPQNMSYASVNFTNGLRTLPGAYFNFTEMAGTTANLTTVMIQFAIPSNLSTTNNIFAYHVHEAPVAAGDNTCMSTGGHFDPFKANGTEGLVNATGGAPSPLYHPSPANLSTFQVGDLAGKWGALTTINGSIAPRVIMEHYLRLSGEYSIMNLSVVIHDAPTDTRIACGNITMAMAFAASNSSNSSSSSGGSGSSSGALPIAGAAGALAATLAITASFVASML